MVLSSFSVLVDLNRLHEKWQYHNDLKAGILQLR